MSFSVAIARKAAREIEEQYNWLAARSESAAHRWRDSLLDAIRMLEEQAERCPEAPEAEWHEGLRQLLHGKRRHIHRILFRDPRANRGRFARTAQCPGLFGARRILRAMRR